MFELLSAMKVLLPWFLLVVVIGFIGGFVRNMIVDFLNTKVGAAITLFGILVFVYLANQGAL